MDSDHIYLSAALVPAHRKESRVVDEWLKDSKPLIDDFIDVWSQLCIELYVCIILLFHNTPKDVWGIADLPWSPRNQAKVSLSLHLGF